MVTPASPSAAQELIRELSAYPQPCPELQALLDLLKRRYSCSVRSVLFYGSCLRSGNPLDGLVDLYVIVDNYRSAYGRRWLSVVNRVLPPNVFYVEVPVASGCVRAKYAVLSIRDLKRGTSRRCFHSYFWGRFAQPTALLFARDAQCATEAHQAFAQAATTFLTRVVPRLPQRCDLQTLWVRGLSLSYGAELRSEKGGRSEVLFAANLPYYRRLSTVVLPGLPYSVHIDSDSDAHEIHAQVPVAIRRLSALAWLLRRIQGKVLSLLRLLKALFTFDGGVDYILWKLERHSGERIEAPPRVRRHPLIFGWPFMWRLYRRGLFR